MKTLIEMKNLFSFNYWKRHVDKVFPHSAQSVLHLTNTISKNEIITGSCGEGSCNCGGGCNGECAN